MHQYKNKEFIIAPTWTTYHVSPSTRFPNNNSYQSSFPLVSGKPQNFRSSDSNHATYETDANSSWTHISRSSPLNVSDTSSPKPTSVSSLNSTFNDLVPITAANLSANLKHEKSQDAKPKKWQGYYKMVGPLTFIDFSKPSNETQEFDDQQGVAVDIVIRDSSILLVIICYFYWSNV